jgi:hypothetical protein
MSQALPTRRGALTVGLRIDGLRLVAFADKDAVNEFALDGQTDSSASAWLDSVLKEHGLAPASPVSLPYKLPTHEVASGGRYDAQGEGNALQELAGWYSAASVMLEDVRDALGVAPLRATPVRCWPHHFDIATLFSLEGGDPEHVRSIGIGVSPGDDFYPQPYVYLGPYPPLRAEGLPALPRPGRWHTRGFVGAVATGEDILKLADRHRDLLLFLTGTFAICRAQLGA